MPFIEINSANIYYQSYGVDTPGRVPVLLIHGSTIDGQTDWAGIAPELAKKHMVLVPDCRGHGKSGNPRLSYSFRELADDAAAFIRALGYERAHVIGHSNGGNVALVTLMEHPDVVTSCIPQAANAYVSRYLVDREPRVLHPDYVEIHNPTMMNEMIALHGAAHGREYWRDLLWMTMREIITEPNYSPSELGRVERPVLVIMGAEDPVNAPDEHAQYIARYIPGAELWIPEQTGHNVHLEHPQEWVARVLDFLDRSEAQGLSSRTQS
jgi:pimeloyl-ACP methyl ester carboxylesterase